MKDKMVNSATYSILIASVAFGVGYWVAHGSKFSLEGLAEIFVPAICLWFLFTVVYTTSGSYIEDAEGKELKWTVLRHMAGWSVAAFFFASAIYR